MVDGDRWRDEYYARVRPIIGPGLAGKRIAVSNVAAVAGAAERLAHCSAVRWTLADDRMVGAAGSLAGYFGHTFVGCRAAQAFAAALRAHNSWEDGWEFNFCPTASYTALAAALAQDRPDLLLGGGTADELLRLGWLADQLGIQAVLVVLTDDTLPHAAILALPGGDSTNTAAFLHTLAGRRILDPATEITSPERKFAWLDANAVAASVARALLLAGTAAPGAAIRAHLAAGRTAIFLGGAWPWGIHYADLGRRLPMPDSAPVIKAADEPGGPVMIVGCGSLGSVAARALAAAGVREFVLVDGDAVEPANPVRQFFATTQVGQNKAAALGERLLRLADEARITCVGEMVGEDEDSAAWFGQLLAATRPAAVLLATGSDADYTLASLLRERDIPHIAGRCYPRAHYFEALIVDGQRGPCFSCLRGHLYTGPRPGPTPEERLRYDSSTPLAPVAAMPATIVESGRAADVLARLTWQLALPSAARAPWLRDLLESGQTCLIGGNEALRVPSLADAAALEWAYGVALPGQVVAFGQAQILGTAATRKCYVCGRVAEVVYQTS